jgi:hypothetical protein
MDIGLGGLEPERPSRGEIQDSLNFLHRYLELYFQELRALLAKTPTSSRVKRFNHLSKRCAPCVLEHLKNHASITEHQKDFEDLRQRAREWLSAQITQEQPAERVS